MTAHVSHLVSGADPIGPTLAYFATKAGHYLAPGYEISFDRFPYKPETWVLIAEGDKMTTVLDKIRCEAHAVKRAVLERYTYLPGIVHKAIRVEATENIIMQLQYEARALNLKAGGDGRGEWPEGAAAKIDGFDVYQVLRLPDNAAWRVVDPWADYR